MPEKKEKRSKVGDYLMVGAILWLLSLGFKGGKNGGGSNGGSPDPAKGDNGTGPDRVTLGLRLATPKHFWHVESASGRDLHAKTALAFPDVRDSLEGPDHVLFAQTPNDALALDRLLSVLPVIFNLFDVAVFNLEVDVGFNALDVQEALARVRAAADAIPAASGLSINLREIK